MAEQLNDPVPANDGSQRATRLAVIAVHGVADQMPTESVRHVANLLARLDAGPEACYSGFAEHVIRIPVRPLPAHSSSTGTFFTAAQSSAEPDIAFTDGQVSKFRTER